MSVLRRTDPFRPGALVPLRAADDDRAMDTQTMVAFVLIGLGAVAAGGAGVRLPPGDRIAAGFALVVGAGVGLASLAVGSRLVGDPAEGHEGVFLVASALGFVATIAGLAPLRRGTERNRRRPEV